MKKNNPYFSDDEINFGDLIKLLWRQKILILPISIICGLASYLYEYFQPQKFKTEITLKNPPNQLFESYSRISSNNIIVQFNRVSVKNWLSKNKIHSSGIGFPAPKWRSSW